MIILDTNVLFELMRVAPDPRVTQWVAKQPEEELFTTSVSEAEIFYGIELIAPGKRRESLLTAAEKTSQDCCWVEFSPSRAKRRVLFRESWFIAARSDGRSAMRMRRLHRLQE